MKPDWKYAPSWAKWVAMDSNGDWYWHEDKPVCQIEPTDAGSRYWCSGSAQVELVDTNPTPWEETLEPRP